MIDTSAPGSWRAALDPEGPACAICRQNTCDHSDAQFKRGAGVGELHSHTTTPGRQHDHG